MRTKIGQFAWVGDAPVAPVRRSGEDAEARAGCPPVPAAVLRLQRAAGNRAVLAGLERGASPTRPVAVQRKVGFELETNWNLRHDPDSEAAPWAKEQVKAAKKARREAKRAAPKQRKRPDESFSISGPAQGRSMGPVRDALDEEEEGPLEDLPPLEAERALPGEDIGKAANILVANGWNLTADTTPTGGAEIEFVTDAFEETAAGRLQLVQAVKQLDKLARELSRYAGKHTVPIKKFSGHGSIASGMSDVAIFPMGPLTANPQTTAGVRIDQVPALVERMLAPPAQGQQRRLGPNALVNADRDVHQQAMDLAKVVADKPAKLDDATRARLRGMLALLYTYMLMGAKPYKYRGQTGPLSISKSIAPLMARTNLGVIFDMVFPSFEQDFLSAFQDPEDFVDLVIDGFGGDGDLFTYGFYKTIGGVEKLQQPGDIGLSRSTWVRGIVHGNDLLRHHATHAPLIHKSLGSLNRSERVGPEEDRADGAILELRRMEGTVPHHQWPALLLNVFDLIRSVNKGG